MKDTIVELRRQEAAECDKVIGIARRVILDVPDMGLTNDKETLQQCIKVIREERPEAVFTHGPIDRHRDHLNTHAISIEARWHAGQPVAAELGESWYPPHLYYYKGVLGNELPSITIDVTQTAEKLAESLATQVSQHTLFRRTKEDFLAEAESIRKNRPKRSEQFWITQRVSLDDFLPLG
jgi:LmbE family N-acetylglucosaminyl deacetylase